MANEVPRGDQDLRVFAVEFHGACAGNLTVLGLTSPQVTDLNDKLLDYDTKLTESIQKRLASKGATAAKDTAKRVLSDALRPLIRIIRGHSVPDELLELLGIGLIDPNQPAQPEQPVNVLATPYANGTNVLRWQRGTNKRATTYQVEVLNANTDGWELVATVNRLSYKHEYQVPGFEQSYRVRAVRKGVLGIPSFTATVYGPEAQGA